MSTVVDLHDVPEVRPADLARTMQALIASENGLIFLNGLTDTSRTALENAIWSTFADEPQRRVAIMVRFECLIELFSSRRLRDQFTHHGLTLLMPAFAIAAQQRLNTHWGFNPQKFLTTLIAKLNPAPVIELAAHLPTQRTAVPQHVAPQLAA